MLTHPGEPIIQVAMLDTAGPVRGEDSDLDALKAQWKHSEVRTFDTAGQLDVWRTNWPSGTKAAAKVIYDRAAGEVRVILHGPGKPLEKTFPVGQDLGRRRYPQAAELLILADSGGSNGARSGLWKYALQAKLVDPYQLAVTVCHYPTGASKWNPIEHRVFSEMSKHCAGLPFTDYATMVERIAGTRTRTGLRVRCALNLKTYPTKLKVSDDQMRSLDLLPHPVLPQWNYTLLPRLNRN